jgi:hypothetical protein
MQTPYPDVGDAHEVLLPRFRRFDVDVAQFEQDFAHVRQTLRANMSPTDFRRAIS